MDRVSNYTPLLDWRATASAASWILGVSIIFACLAYCEWLAHAEQRTLPNLLRDRSAQRSLVSGLLLVFGGLAAAEQSALQRIALISAGGAAMICLRWLSRPQST